eukprot:244869-Pelagomonas_calceolata.AAC.4
MVPLQLVSSSCSLGYANTRISTTVQLTQLTCRALQIAASCHDTKFSKTACESGDSFGSILNEMSVPAERPCASRFPY